MRYKVHTDGAARGNPGPAAIGIVVQDESGRTVYEASRSLGIRTNNEAEYLAFIAALEYLRESRVAAADFYLDSELVVRQLTGAYRVKEPRLQSLHAQATMLLNAVPRHAIHHVRRELNARADELANEALDAEA
jgi:ribonuclease HI